MFPQLKAQPIESLSTTQLVPLGEVVFLDNGRLGYKYIKFGGTSAITAGKLLVAAAAPANSTGLALPTTNSTAQLSAGSTQLLVTNGATAVTQDQFAGGYLEVIGTNGNSKYSIVGNTADSGTGTLTIQLGQPLRNTTALANGTNTVNLRASMANGPVASLTQAMPVGVTIMPVANSATVTNYGWVQVAGPAFIFATSGTKGFPATQDLAGTAGYVAVTGAGASETVPQIGIFQESAASSLASVFLQLN